MKSVLLAGLIVVGLGPLAGAQSVWSPDPGALQAEAIENLADGAVLDLAAGQYTITRAAGDAGQSVLPLDAAGLAIKGAGAELTTLFIPMGLRIEHTDTSRYFPPVVISDLRLVFDVRDRDASEAPVPAIETAGLQAHLTLRDCLIEVYGPISAESVRSGAALLASGGLVEVRECRIEVDAGADGIVVQGGDFTAWRATLIERARRPNQGRHSRNAAIKLLNVPWSASSGPTRRTPTKATLFEVETVGFDVGVACAGEVTAMIHRNWCSCSREVGILIDGTDGVPDVRVLSNVITIREGRGLVVEPGSSGIKGAIAENMVLLARNRDLESRARLVELALDCTADAVDPAHVSGNAVSWTGAATAAPDEGELPIVEEPELRRRIDEWARSIKTFATKLPRDWSQARQAFEALRDKDQG